MTYNEPGDRLRNLAIANRQLITRHAGNRFPDEGKEIRVISCSRRANNSGTQGAANDSSLKQEKVEGQKGRWRRKQK